MSNFICSAMSTKKDNNKSSKTTDPLAKTISRARMERLMLIDEFLTRRGREGEPATTAEICSFLGLSENQERGVRKNLKSLCELSDDIEKCSDFPKSAFKLIKNEDSVPVTYMIEPGHSLFRRDLNSLFYRDLSYAEKKLIGDIFKTMGSFGIPSLKHIEDLTKEAGSGLSKELSEKECVDLGVKPPEDKSLFSSLFDAIASRSVIKLYYRPMKLLSDSSAPISSIMFCPWQLKVFPDHRWGLIGMDASDGFILKFYLNQIESIVKYSDKYDEREMKRMKRLFDNVVGMSAPKCLCKKKPAPEDMEYPQDVYVWVDPCRVQYLRSFPLHDTMDEIEDSSEQARLLRNKYPGLPEGGAFFWMNVYISHSLKQLLASYLDRMIVLEPESLRIDLEERIGNMKTIYESLHHS